VVTENFRRGTLEKLGLGYDVLSAANPGLIYCAISGYGRSGPAADKGGFDLIAQGFAGLMSVTGEAGGPPVKNGNSVADINGGILAALGIAAAYAHKLRTGEGQRIDVSLFDTAIALQCQEIAAFLNMERGFERSRAGIGGAWLAAPFGIYRTADGHLALAMASLAVVGELLEEPRLAAFDDPRRAYDDRDEVYELVQAKLIGRTTASWLELLATKDVWCAPVQSFDEVVEDPQVAHNELLTTVEHPSGGTLRVVGVPVRFSVTPGSIRWGPPAVGQHTDEVLAAIGYSDEEIGTLRDDGVV
jgi:crotonobetainyl-CoA:carnitine CoA-transferase CaiB-like acyl-CoA transferase